MAANEISFLVYRLGDRRFALLLEGVERVLRAVAVEPLPQAPPAILGLVNIQGEILPAIQTRLRVGLPARPLAVEDRMILVHAKSRRLVLVVDAIEEVQTRPRDQVYPADAVAPGVEGLAGVIRLEDGLLLIHDLDAFLSADEEKALDEALRDAGPVLSRVRSAGLDANPTG